MMEVIHSVSLTLKEIRERDQIELTDKKKNQGLGCHKAISDLYPRITVRVVHTHLRIFLRKRAHLNQ